MKSSQTRTNQIPFNLSLIHRIEWLANQLYFQMSCTGPKTVHFYCPFVKWGLVIAGLGDYFRPADKLSVRQSMAFGVTGMIWSRFCFVITPRNYNLLAVNLSVGCMGLYQLGRIYMYNFAYLFEKYLIISIDMENQILNHLGGSREEFHGNKAQRYREN